MRSSLPKVLQALAGRPLLAHVIDCARRLGADDVCVVYGHGGEAVPEAFEAEPVRWVLQAEQQRTGQAVQHAMPGTPDGNRVLVLYGDVPLIRRATLERLMAAGDPDDVALLTVDMDDPSGYGRIVRRDGRGVKIVEQRDGTAAALAVGEINSGVGSAPAARLSKWLSRVGSENCQGEV
jgi:bifunctional UDP-N-acetylglucosamine pyrophosphorylase/glucosamine-1-phosphate N-acetyltransferase